MSSAFYYITMLYPTFECSCLRVSYNTLNLPTVCWDPLTSLPSNEAPADDTHVKWRQMVDESWPLTLVIRYGRSNWLAVFPINRHYGPLCQPAPLAALLFLEAPGSSRVPVLLSPPCRSILLLYQQHHSISGLIQQIGSNRGSLIDILAHFFLMSAFAQKIIIYSRSHICHPINFLHRAPFYSRTSHVFLILRVPACSILFLLWC